MTAIGMISISCKRTASESHGSGTATNQAQPPLQYSLLMHTPTLSHSLHPLLAVYFSFPGPKQHDMAGWAHGLLHFLSLQVGFIINALHTCCAT